MQIVRFLPPHGGGSRLGLVDGPHIIDLAQAATERGLSWLVPTLSDLRAFLHAGEAGRAAATMLGERARHARLDRSNVRLLAPYEVGAKVLAQVVNYPGHDEEAKVKLPAKPFFFQKPGSSISNPGDPIVAHSVSKKLDHESELVVVIGRIGRNIAAEDAYAHVAGYTIGNDVSYRDFQMNEDFPDLNASYGKNWTQGKGLDMACPIGPALVLTDEVAVPYPLRLTCRVNGDVRTDASTEAMIHKVPALVAEASRGMTLYPGDLILTGTPMGGGIGTGKFLRPGDVVECEIERLGVLRNVVISDEPLHQDKADAGSNVVSCTDARL